MGETNPAAGTLALYPISTRRRWSWRRFRFVAWRGRYCVVQANDGRFVQAAWLWEDAP